MLLSRIARLALAGLAAASFGLSQVHLTGRVVDENDAPIPNARVTAQMAEQPPLEAFTLASGTFTLTVPAPGNYLITVQRAGYFLLQNRPVQVAVAGAEVTLTLNTQREVFQSVTVGALPTPVQAEQVQREQALSGTEVNDVPYPASHSLRNALKLIPGVIQDPSGGVHFHGGAEYQTRYLLDGFDISDPIDGRYSTRLAVEGVRSLDLVSSRESPQYGRSSAGTLQIQTDNGTDQFRYTATNFIPGIQTNNGLSLGDWTPRAGISGPIVKGRAWFSNSLDTEYNSGFLKGLPSGQDTNPAWYAGNLLHTQVNLAPANILYADLMTNFDHQAHYGLGVLDPIPTTTALGNSNWLAAIKDSRSWSGGTTIEGGFAWQRVYHRRTPMGDSPYILSPDGRRGNYFVDSQQDGRRDQVFVNFFPRAWRFAGRHQLQIGADTQRLSYDAAFHRTGFEVVGLAGLPLFTTTFQGSGDFERTAAAQSSYINDHWQLAGNLYIDAGLRQDWDSLVRKIALGPRVAASWAPFADARTKFTAGYAILHDAPDLALFSRPLDQQSVTVPYTDGIAGTPLVTRFVAGNDLRLPRSQQWSAGAEHDFGSGISGSLQWLRRRGRDGFVYAPETATDAVDIQPLALGYGFGGTYALANLRRDAYDEAALTVRQSFGEQYGWMASYVRSRAVSNAVLDVNVDQPLQVLNDFGRMPWDAPNRVLGWGYLPTPWKNWAVSVLADWRTGFPFAITNEAGMVEGPVDVHRYPAVFDLNVHIERRFTFAGYRLALRLGANNLTAHHNPTAVNNVAGSPQFLQFFGDEGRHFVVRIRVFGKAGR